MKSFLKNLGGRGDDAGSLVGRVLKVGPHDVKVDSKLAEGGYASIYKVHDAETGRAFALKQIRVQGNPEALDECKVEARVMHLLRGHPHILKLHAVSLMGPKGSEDCLILLDLCEGSLVEAARRGHLDPARALEAFEHVCRALAHMHSQSPPLSHRDLKPENVLRHPEGRWVLCDFGSATSRAQAYSGADMYVEEERIRKYTTPAYRAPEMWDLLCNEKVDTRADIWALGCILYWLTFAKLAFTGESKLGILNGKYDMPARGGSEGVRLLIKDMLVVDPKLRPDVTAVLARLEHIRHSNNGNSPNRPVTPATAAHSQVQDSAQPGSTNVKITRSTSQPRPVLVSPEAPETWTATFDSGTLPSDQAALAARNLSATPESGQHQHIGFDRYVSLLDSEDTSINSDASKGHYGLKSASPLRVEKSHSGSVSGSEASIVTTPTAGTPTSARNGEMRLAEENSMLRKQLQDAISSNATLNARVARLEAMVRSQAATISALHSQQQAWEPSSASSLMLDQTQTPSNSSYTPVGESAESPISANEAAPPHSFGFDNAPFPPLGAVQTA